jgi:hypothetical protein
LLSLLVLVSAALLARGQTFTSNPYNDYGSGYANPYWGYSYDPYSNYLQGASSVIRAQGKFMVEQQQAYLQREQVRSARIDVRRKELEQWLWEREHLPTAEDERQRTLAENLRHYRNDPPVNEIWSASALNGLLADARKIRSPGTESAAPVLREEVLAKINVTSGKSGGNIGLLKEGQLNWPMLLNRPAFDAERTRLDWLAAEALKEANQGKIDPKILEETASQAADLQRKLVALAKTLGDGATWTPNSYKDAKNFLSQLDDAIKVLQQVDAANYLNGKYAAKGRNVAELVHHMSENGLQFAPCTPGSENAYRALYDALRAYDTDAGSPTRPKP